MSADDEKIPEQPEPQDEFVEESTSHDLAALELAQGEAEAAGGEPEPLAPVDEFPDEEATLSGGSHNFSEVSAEIQRELHLQSIIESLLFVADKPLTLQQLAGLLGESDLGPVRAALGGIETNQAHRGIQLHAVAGGFQFRSNPANATWVQKLLAQKPVRLSRALLETLAIVAYRQPITRPEIDDIRGVDSGGTLKTLMERSLVRILGKKEEPGRPILYGSTKEFLEFFNLRDLKDLPTLREFHELSDEHRAQVEALEAAAPEGSIETEAEADAAMQQNVLSRVDFKAPPEDSAELDEIDRLINTAIVPEPEPEKPEKKEQ
jgi:segregation and condensation protein B